MQEHSKTSRDIGPEKKAFSREYRLEFGKEGKSFPFLYYTSHVSYNSGKAFFLEKNLKKYQRRYVNEDVCHNDGHMRRGFSDCNSGEAFF